MSVAIAILQRSYYVYSRQKVSTEEYTEVCLWQLVCVLVWLITYIILCKYDVINGQSIMSASNNDFTDCQSQIR
jgi:hypothetical protein